jgi:hypothetical protein
MFGWLKRRAQLVVVSSATVDIDRFIAGLKGANKVELGLILLVAAHWRNTYKERLGIDLSDPIEEEMKDASFKINLNRQIAGLQGTPNQFLAPGLMVWLHSARACTIPEVRYKGKEMWSLLMKGLDHITEAEITLESVWPERLMTNGVWDPPLDLIDD